MYKKSVCKVVLLLIKTFFLDVLVAVASMDLKVPYELVSTLKPCFAMLGGKYDYRVLKSRDFLIL